MAGQALRMSNTSVTHSSAHYLAICHAAPSPAVGTRTSAAASSSSQRQQRRTTRLLHGHGLHPPHPAPTICSSPAQACPCRQESRQLHQANIASPPHTTGHRRPGRAIPPFTPGIHSTTTTTTTTTPINPSTAMRHHGLSGAVAAAAAQQQGRATL